MPRLKRREGPYDRLLRLLKAYDLSGGQELAAALKCSKNTAYARLDDPGKLTVAELRKINRAGVPWEEIKSAM